MGVLRERSAPEYSLGVMSRSLYVILLLVGSCVTLSLTGCELFGALAQAFFPEKVKPLYQPDDRPMLILVDDPGRLLGNPAVPHDIANQIGFFLIQQSVLSKSHHISPSGLYDLAARLGPSYAQTPIDQIGKQLGAQQVMYVYVHGVSLGQEPGLFRPAAVVRVKIIDVVGSKQLFPGASREPLSPDSPYHDVKIEMFYHGASDYSDERVRVIRQLLARRIARDVSRLFYEYLPRQPGDRFED